MMSPDEPQHSQDPVRGETQLLFFFLKISQTVFKDELLHL